MDPVQHESIEGEYEPEGLLSPLPVETPAHFDEEEWLKLTEVIITHFNHSIC
jgi:hypothetical protein